MEYFIIVILIIVALYLGFKIGWFLANQLDDKNDKEAISTLKDLYCFECEIDMPVKKKNGRLSCSNCGLPH